MQMKGAFKRTPFRCSLLTTVYCGFRISLRGNRSFRNRNFSDKRNIGSAFADKISGRILRYRGGIAADGKSRAAEKRSTLLERESIRRRAINLLAETIRNIRYRSALPHREGLLLFYTLPAARQAAPHRFRNSPHNVFRPNYAQCPQV